MLLILKYRPRKRIFPSIGLEHSDSSIAVRLTTLENTLYLDSALKIYRQRSINPCLWTIRLTELGIQSLLEREVSMLVALIEKHFLKFAKSFNLMPCRLWLRLAIAKMILVSTETNGFQIRRPLLQLTSRCLNLLEHSLAWVFDAVRFWTWTSLH